MSDSSPLQRNLPILGASVRNIVIFITVLSIPLTSAQNMGLTETETSSWILALYGIPPLLNIILVLIYRQPLLLTGNLFLIIFINGLGDTIPFPQLVGAAMLAGAAVAAVGLLGVTKWMASWVPVPIMFGLLAGAVLPFLSDIFTRLGDTPWVVGGTLLVYLLSRRILREHVPPILPALLAGLGLAWVTGGFQPVAEPLILELPALTGPVFSLPVILTATPVFVVLITLQANLPALRFLQSQDYQPPERVIDIVSGLGMMVGSLLGPVGVSLSLPATSLAAGPEAGDHDIRHRTIYIVSVTALLVGIFAGAATALAGALPMALLLTLAGLSVVDVLMNAVTRFTEGPLRLGPLFAFAIALSDVSFLGFGNYFWSLVIGTGVSLLLEGEGFHALRQQSMERD